MHDTRRVIVAIDIASPNACDVRQPNRDHALIRIVKNIKRVIVTFDDRQETFRP